MGVMIIMKRLAALIAGLALAAFMFACGGETTDTKSNTNTSTNVASNANANANVSSNANSNAGGYNANITQQEYEKSKETFGQKAKELGDKIGTSVTDGWLWVKTRGALLAADDLEESGINVDVNDGVIVLRGTVPNQDQIRKADAAAKGISGNKGVQNQLKVAASGNANAATKATPAKK